jgi:mannitol-1-/sugar-/sorbitol-6-phosphatase
VGEVWSDDDGRAPGGAVLFDLDGVIVDSTATVEDVWRRWALGHDVDVERLVAFSHGRPTRETLTRFAPDLDPLAEGLELEREAVRIGAEPIAGTIELYRALPDVARGVATSARRETALARFEAAELPLPLVLVTADDVAAGKPAPDCYLLAASLLDVPPTECIVVEDAPAGIEAARTAGMRVIALTTTHPAFELGEADVCLTDPGDLSRAVERLRRGEPARR